MRNHWLARFVDEPALVAPHQSERFEQCLAALSEGPDADFLATVKAEASGDFWTELGRASKILRPYVVDRGILIVPIKGVLLHEFPYQFYSYATGYEYIRAAVDRGMIDPDVRGIAFLHNSPGGMVSGNFDLVDHIFDQRGVKPMRSFAAESSYSASYSLASAADRITVARTGGVGSIGVVTTHLDVSKAMEEIGFKVTFIHFGKHKIDGNAYEPLPDDVKARIQARVDALGEMFVATVARNRNLNAEAVRATEAQTFTAAEALQNGLADDVGAFERALAEFAADVTNPDSGDETMSDLKTATVDMVKAENADLAAALIEEGRQAALAETQTQSDAAMAAERARVAGLDGLLAKMGGSEEATKIVAAAKADGSSVEATALKLVEGGVAQKASVLGAIAADDTSAAAGKPAGAGAGQTFADNEEGWKAEYAAKPELQSEFSKVEYYVAHKKLEQRSKPNKAA